MNEEPKKGDQFRPVITVLKVKKGIPTVVDIDGRRYVYEPNTKWK